MKETSGTEDWSFRFVIGIDLGTTNSAVAFVDLADERRQIKIFKIPQVVSLGEIAERSLLPSFLYLPGSYEVPLDQLRLPWKQNVRDVVGEFAREQGALVPERLVSSAKSWLCHARVDRKAPILPWGVSGDDVRKVSPVEASAKYLEHIRESWNYVVARDDDELRFEEQLIVLTVPASFDEVARELTVEAARMAGIPRLVLLEEPLAAFYAWLSRHRDNWQEQLQAGHVILVCDVGGGTTDFTIVAFREGEKGLRFDRLAVGEHLLLGGDNMDLAIGRHVEIGRFGKAGALDSKQWHQLCHQCRKAKEQLLENPDIEAVKVTVVGRGTRLIGDTVSVNLSRQEVEDRIIEGFFPFCNLDDELKSSGRSGLTEWGLPYVQDPAITRHLASFWRRFEDFLKSEVGRKDPYPDFILFNGGALAPAVIRRRLLNVVGSWFEDRAGKGWKPGELHNPKPDLAVAFGAAYYGMVRLGFGVRVGAGTPRSYYVQVDSGQDDDGGMVYRGVCIVPRGSEEGFEAELRNHDFQVITNRPVAFQVLCSTTRLEDRLGDIVDLPDGEVTPLPPIRTVLRFGKKGVTQQIPVTIACQLSEVGTLDIWCKSLKTPHKWKLRFDVRQHADTEKRSILPGEIFDEELLNEASNLIKNVFTGGHSEKRLDPDALVKHLTKLFGTPREKWSLLAIRKLADTLLGVAEGRKLTFRHEARWLNLLGFCMRPGYGDPVDEWRIRQIWRIYHQGLSYHRQPMCRLEWWIFWRRVAGGLSAGQQLHVYQQHSAYFQHGETKGRKKARKLNSQEITEFWMAFANFERLPVEVKVLLGRRMLDRVLSQKKPRHQDLWSLAKLGARIPLYGPIDRVVSADEVMKWISALLDKADELGAVCVRPIVHMARLTGDRARDLPEDFRRRIYETLLGLEDDDKLKVLFKEPSEELSLQEQEWAFGESLPSGLVLGETNQIK